MQRATINCLLMRNVSVPFDVNVEFMIRTIYLENHAHAIKAVATTKRQFAQAGPQFNGVE